MSASLNEMVSALKRRREKQMASTTRREAAAGDFVYGIFSFFSNHYLLMFIDQVRRGGPGRLIPLIQTPRTILECDVDVLDRGLLRLPSLAKPT